MSRETPNRPITVPWASFTGPLVVRNVRGTPPNSSVSSVVFVTPNAMISASIAIVARACSGECSTLSSWPMIASRGMPARRHTAALISTYRPRVSLR